MTLLHPIHILIVSMAFYAFQLLLRTYINRAGPRKAIGWALFGASIVIFMFGWSTHYVWHVFVLILSGGCQSVIMPASMKALSTWHTGAPEAEGTSLLWLWGSSLYVGQLLGTAVALFFRELIGWRNVFVIPALVSAFVSVAVLRLLRMPSSPTLAASILPSTRCKKKFDLHRENIHKEIASCGNDNYHLPDTRLMAATNVAHSGPNSTALSCSNAHPSSRTTLSHRPALGLGACTTAASTPVIDSVDIPETFETTSIVSTSTPSDQPPTTTKKPQLASVAPKILRQSSESTSVMASVSSSPSKDPSLSQFRFDLAPTEKVLSNTCPHFINQTQATKRLLPISTTAARESSRNTLESNVGENIGCSANEINMLSENSSGNDESVSNYTQYDGSSHKQLSTPVTIRDSTTNLESLPATTSSQKGGIVRELLLKADGFLSGEYGLSTDEESDSDSEVYVLESLPHNRVLSIGQVLRLEHLLPLGLLYCFVNMMRYCVHMWLPLYFQEHFFLTQRAAGLLSTLFELGALFGCVLIRLCHRVFGERQIMASQLALLIGGIATVLVHKGASAGSGFSFFFLLIMGVCYGGVEAIISTSLAIRIGKDADAVTSVVSVISCFGALGAFLQALLVSQLIRHYGLYGGFYLVVVMVSLPLVASFFARSIDRRQHKTQVL